MRRFILFLFTFITCLNLPIKSFASEDSKIESLLLKAQQEDKHVLVRFSATWCLPCQILDDQIANHPEIQKRLNELYINIELDYDEPDDLEWFVRYGVQCLPTMMVIDDMGEVIDRIDGSGSMEEIEMFVRMNSKHPVEKIDTKDLSDVNYSNSKIDITHVKTKPTIKSFKPADFSIQFGAFSSYENASKLSTILSTSENINTLIFEESMNGKILYKVRQTYFPDHKSGNVYIKAYKEKGIDCILKKA